MKYIYGLYDQKYPNTIRYIGQTNDPPRRLRDHWGSRDKEDVNRAKEWDHRLTAWLASLRDIPIMKILLPVDDSEADRAEHDAIVQAWNSYGTGQILNDNSGIDNSSWFHSIMSGPDIRVTIGSSSTPRVRRTQRERMPTPYSERGTRVNGKVPRSVTQNMEIAAWCEENGIPLGYNRRVPVDGLRAYREAHSINDGSV